MATKTTPETKTSTPTPTTRKTVTPEQVEQARKAVEANGGTKSGAIRQLSAAGFTQGDIARALTQVFYPEGDRQVRPQHVSNVLRQAKEKTASTK